MSFTRRLTGYLRTLVRTRAERRMDPEIEIEQAIGEARRRDADLRQQAARVVAHRTLLERHIEQSAQEVGETQELTKQALLRGQDAGAKGDAAAAERWNATARSLAMRLQATEYNLASMQDQYQLARDQAEEAKEAVGANAMRLQELAAQRMQLLGVLQQARMQESVNSAMQSLSITLDAEAPSLERVRAKVEARRAEAQAHAELRATTPEGAEAELRQSLQLGQADARLDALRAELGIGAGGVPGGQLGHGAPAVQLGSGAPSGTSLDKPATGQPGPPGRGDE